MLGRQRVLTRLLFAVSLLAGPLACAQENRVVMTDQLSFKPEVLTIEAGDTVTWVNESVMVHTATADPAKATQAASVSLPEGAESFDSGMLEKGERFSHTFAQPGRYHYFCIPHEGAKMYGVIEVKE